MNVSTATRSRPRKELNKDFIFNINNKTSQMKKFHKAVIDPDSRKVQREVRRFGSYKRLIVALAPSKYKVKRGGPAEIPYLFRLLLARGVKANKFMWIKNSISLKMQLAVDLGPFQLDLRHKMNMKLYLIQMVAEINSVENLYRNFGQSAKEFILNYFGSPWDAQETLHTAIRDNLSKTFCVRLVEQLHVNELPPTLLHCAVKSATYYSKNEMVTYLLKANVDVDALDKNKNTALHYASYLDNQFLVTILIDAGANLNIKCGGRTPLLNALHFKNYTIAKILLNAGANIHLTDENKQTSLHIVAAAVRDNVKMVTFLLEKGADKFAKDVNGRTPLDLVKSTATDKEHLIALLT